jgi:hypothetical protein
VAAGVCANAATAVNARIAGNKNDRIKISSR